MINLDIEPKLEKEIKDGSFFDVDYFNGNSKSNYGSYNEIGFFKDFARYVMRYFPKRLLEVGCSRGFSVKWWRRYGVEAYGIDISKWAVENAPEEVKRSVLVGDIKDIKFPDNFFDVVISLETIEHVIDKNIDKAISELYRVCSDICIISTPLATNETSHDYLADGDKSHVSIHSKDYWLDKFKAAGFEFVSQGFKIRDSSKKSIDEEGSFYNADLILVFKKNNSIKADYQ